MKLVVGLGNPGKKYQYTRHNVGFMFIDKYAKIKDCVSFKCKFEGEYTTFKHNDEDIILFRPLTYMNLSGTAIRQIVDYYKINLEDILVIYDDKDIPFAKTRLRVKGNPGSHNGMKDITLKLQSNEFKRIRVGIGSPESMDDMINFVLSPFNEEQLKELDVTFNDIADAVDLFIDNKFDIAMNKYNFRQNKNG